mmetsp:Transcript_53874/g.153492  ORF Transcript_53874/g.153492 Transcript_53874/m.153492 type:complete len:252 (+) Transcript_53874:1471-2226(+)
MWRSRRRLMLRRGAVPMWSRSSSNRGRPRTACHWWKTFYLWMPMAGRHQVTMPCGTRWPAAGLQCLSTNENAGETLRTLGSFTRLSSSSNSSSAGRSCRQSCRWGTTCGSSLGIRTTLTLPRSWRSPWSGRRWGTSSKGAAGATSSCRPSGSAVWASAAPWSCSRATSGRPGRRACTWTASQTWPRSEGSTARMTSSGTLSGSCLQARGSSRLLTTAAPRRSWQPSQMSLQPGRRATRRGHSSLGCRGTPL